jgi:hypothetical protein
MKRAPGRHLLLACVAFALPCAAQTQAQPQAKEDEDRPQSVGTQFSSFWSEFKQVWNQGETQRFRLEYENDLFFNTDRNYTDGVRFTFKRGSDHPSKFDADENPRVPPLRFRAPRSEAERAKMREQDEYDCALPARDAAEYELGIREMREQTGNPEARESMRPYCYKSSYSVVAGHNMYTASDIRLPSSQIPAKDRPYAAWAYVGLHREIYSSDDRYWRYGIDIGCMGPCAYGRQLQTWIHEKITNSPLPNGWDSQIRNEFGAVIRFEHAWRSWRIGPSRDRVNRPDTFGEGFFGVPLAADLRPSFNFGLGNIQTYAGMGVTARVGWFRSGYDTLRLDTHPIESLARNEAQDEDVPVRSLPEVYAQANTGTKNDASLKAAAKPMRATRAPKGPPKPELFAFGRLHGDLVAYNALLQGGMFNHNNPKTASARPLIMEREFGVMGAYRELSVSLSMVIRHEWEVSGTRYGQRFGRLTVEFSTRF